MFNIRVQVEHVRVRVRNNYSCVRTPVQVERVFVFGERCSSAALLNSIIEGFPESFELFGFPNILITTANG